MLPVYYLYVSLLDTNTEYPFTYLSRIIGQEQKPETVYHTVKVMPPTIASIYTDSVIGCLGLWLEWNRPKLLSRLNACCYESCTF